jgi:hemerythrin
VLVVAVIQNSAQETNGMDEHEWSEDLSIGVEQIDNQHRELFQRIGSLRWAIRNGQGRGALLETLAFLEEYVDAHFTAEEALMQQHDYPGILEQKKEHEGFLKELLSFKEKLIDMEIEGEFTAFLEIEIERKLSGWLAEHIGTIDRKLGTFLTEKM